MILVKILVMIEFINENNVIGIEIFKDIKIGKMMIVIEIIGLIFVIDMNIIVVIIYSKFIVIFGLFFLSLIIL